MRHNHLRSGITLALALLLAAPAAVRATNGMYLTAYGPETLGRGGANLAISDRTLALNFNPAGIAQLQGNHLSASISVLAPSLEFENLANQPSEADSRYFPMPNIAYVRGGKDSPLTWGVGLVGQGGMGATFRDLNTFFGTRDETFTQIRFMTFTPTVAWSLNEDMAVGVSVNLGYADASFRFFPETSFFNTQLPEMSFFGVNMRKASGFQSNVRVGWWWRPDPKFSVGAIYQSKTADNYSGGDMYVNFEDHPQLARRVLYEAELEGFTFAAQAGVGVAVRPDDKWTVAVDLKRYFWDDAIDTITVMASNPDYEFAPPELQLPFVFEWKDQWVLALGADYRASQQLTLRGGYNFGENPVPADTLTPLFPAITEHHISFGASWLTRGGTTWELGVEHAFNASLTNDNPDPMVNPFGPGARVDHSQWTFSVGASWAWARD